MTSQRVLPFRTGRHVRFARHLGVLFGQARDLFWSDEPSCLVRRSYDSAELVRESPGCLPPTRLSASSQGPRLMGLAAPRTGDGLVIVHEHPRGARLVTQRGKELVAERIWPEEHGDVAIATNGQRIVVSESRRAELSCYADWSLGSPTTWSLAPVRRALGEVRLNVVGLRDLALEQRTIQTNLLQQGNFVFANVCQFALLGGVVFILPQFTEATGQSIPQITAALLFMFGPIGVVLYALPAYSKANLACQNILTLENKLDAIAPPPQSVSSQDVAEPFRELELVDVEFARTDASGKSIFTVGPISFSVRAGDIVFLVGGNGSGKTTLLRTLTALYPPTSGSLRVNGVLVTQRNVQSYREMIAAIFTGFHLFKKLYGLPDAQDDKAQQLLAQMEIADKTHLSEGTWSTVDLSTGQRKRIAMVVALLEDRPIYIFDEWAADQDPEFRSFFYEELLQDLKKQGKAVVAISHDDRYFHCADRVITLEYGKVRSIEQHRVPLHAAPTSGPPPA